MKSVTILILALAVSACLAPSGDSLPDWVDSPREHPRCSRREALCAVGIATGEGEAPRELARKRAIEQIVSSILVSVQSTIDVDTTSRRTSDDVFWTDEVRERIRVTTQQEDLPGVEVVERWVNPGRREVYVLVRVPRDLLMDRWLPGVGAAIAEAESFLTTADEFSTRDPGRAIHNTLEAYRVVSGAYGDAVKANVVGRDSPWAGDARRAFGHASQLLADTSARLARLVGGVSILKLSGDGQPGSVRGDLRDPLQVRLEFRDHDGKLRPLVNVPVRFAPATPGAATILADSSTTDSAGEITCRVTDLNATGLASNEIAVQPGFRSVAPDLSDRHVPAVSFTYHLPTAAQTTVVVALEERYDGRDLSTPFMADGLAAFLSGFGFDVRRPGATRKRLDTTDLTLLRSALGPDVDYLIRGRTYARYSSFERQLHWYRAAAQLQIVHVDTGRISSLDAGEVKDAHLSESESGAIQALKMLRGPLYAKLEIAFVADFVSPATLEP
jgi:hypothetical protein